MKKVLLILCALALISFTANAKDYEKKEIQKCQNKKSPYIVACDSTGKPITGRVRTFSKDGEAETEDNYVGGKLVKTRDYHPNGKLSSETIYSNNKTATKAYYENGKLMHKGSTKNEKKEGFWRYYFENGKTSQEITFKNGKAVSGFDYNERGIKEKMPQIKLDSITNAELGIDEEANEETGEKVEIIISKETKKR